MKKIFKFPILILLGLVCFNLAYAEIADLQDNAEKLREQLEQEREKAKSLENQKKRLMRMINSEKGRLKRYDKIIRNYEYNLAEAQRFIDAANAEVKKISQRNKERRFFFDECLHVLEKSLNRYSTQDISSQMQLESFQIAAEQITINIFNEIQSEKPRMEELLDVIKEKQDYQELILTKYMPVDLEVKKNKEELITEKQAEIEKTENAYQKQLAEVEKLRDQLEAWEKRIAEINRQRQLAEEKRRREEQRRIAEQRKKEQQKIAAQQQKNSSQPVSEAKTDNFEAANLKPFSKLKGNLGWPARGTITRPFGEFTHPQFKVKMKSPGIDVQVAAGTPIKVVAPGEVLLTGDIPGFGRTIIVTHDEGYLSVYGNVTESVSKNDTVNAGQTIGHVIGNNGNAIYHFELRQGKQAINPQLWLNGS